MMKTPKISVVVPVYKAEQYLSGCIDSILSQKFVNFELLLVDDGSPDNSGKICDKYAAEDSRVKVLHKDNGGVTSARKCGVDSAVGEYIYFSDADDSLPIDALQKAITFLEDNNLDILVTAKNRVVDNKITHVIENEVLGAIDSSNYLIAMLSNKCKFSPHGRFIRRSLFLKGDAFATPRTIFNNEDLFMNAIVTSFASKIFTCNDIISYNHHKREGSASSSKCDIKYWEMVFEYLDNVLKNHYTITAEISNAIMLYKLERVHKLEWAELNGVSRVTFIKKIEQIKMLSRLHDKMYLMLKYPYVSFFIRLYYKIL